MIDSIFDDLLLSSTAIAATVGNRVRPLARDEQTPCISFQKDDETQEIDISGKPYGPKQADFTVSCFDKSYSTVKTLANDVKTHLLTQKGTFDNINIMLIVYNSIDDDYDDETKIYITELTFTIYFEG